MAYEEFESLKGGKNGSVMGEVPFDSDGASAFMYAKNINIFVPMTVSFGQSPIVKPTGSWKLRIRDSRAKDSSGKLVGAILFEQTVKLTSTVVAMNFGGIDFVSWTGGTAEVQTTICDGQSCAIIEKIETATPEQKAAYVETGAWRFFDLYTNTGATAEAKYNLERGDVRKDQPDYGGAIGGFHFFGKWVSAAYKCSIPAGAVVEILYDQWQFGRLREATYQLSWKKGVGKSPFFNHPAGFMVSANTDKQDILINTFNDSPKEKEGVSRIKNATPVSIARSEKTGEIYLGMRGASGSKLAVSKDDGASFTEMAQAFDNSYTTHDFELLFAGTAGAVATKNGKIYYKPSYDGGESWEGEIEVNKVASGMKTLSLRQHRVSGKATLTITDSATCRFDSTTDGASWRAVESAPETTTPA